ncbi:MAG: LuxR family transcriptional regulator [Alphaproteobacteria bacterium]|nr:LuxR family transcriptional regulator [Alphaproteobacteria bacterium]
MKNLDDYIALINSAETPEEAFSRYASIMEREGYGRAVYSLVTDHPSLGLPRQHGLVTNYPEHWMKYYRQNNYIDVDPVIERIARSRVPFFWSDLDRDPNIRKSSKLLMDEADEAGVSDGIGISLISSPGEIVGVGLCRTEPNKAKARHQKRNYQLLANAYFLTVYFHETYKNMISPDHQISLTVREKEILCWAVESKTDEEIAAILNISFSTVRFHWNKIFKKLDAYGRVYAMTKAIRLGLIDPVLIGTPLSKVSVS